MEGKLINHLMDIYQILFINQQGISINVIKDILNMGIVFS